jgi:hypothetical protein
MNGSLSHDSHQYFAYETSFAAFTQHRSAERQMRSCHEAARHLTWRPALVARSEPDLLARKLALFRQVISGLVQCDTSGF